MQGGTVFYWMIKDIDDLNLKLSGPWSTGICKTEQLWHSPHQECLINSGQKSQSEEDFEKQFCEERSSRERNVGLFN